MSLRPGHLETPDVRRLSPSHPRYAEILERHRQAVASGLPSYPDPVSGLQVLTAAVLASRGDCCTSGCRHCPYVGGT